MVMKESTQSKAPGQSYNFQIWFVLYAKTHICESSYMLMCFASFGHVLGQWSKQSSSTANLPVWDSTCQIWLVGRKSAPEGS